MTELFRTLVKDMPPSTIAGVVIDAWGRYD